ncbi:MAG TPA: DedA family protein [Thermoleophilaceae bacterium]|nr:DedA family protein [Thermoleophilaceae bacterium]
MFEFISHWVSGQPLSYLVVLGVAGFDVIFPLLPAETIVLTAGTLSAQGHLMIWLILLAAAVGAFCGDNVCFFLGRQVGDPIAHFLFRGEKGRQRLAWAESAIKRRGPLLILVGRFLPGGRTASTFAAGTLEMEWKRFAIFDAIAAVVWAVYAGMLGYLGGETFRHSLWKPLLIAFGIASLVGLGAEVYRRAQKKRGKDVLGDPLERAGT